MDDDEWQVKAVNEQFDVFESLTTPSKHVSSTDLMMLMTEVADIKNSYMKMDKPSHSNPRDISLEIMKHSDGSDLKLSFVVIVTNIEIEGELCKMPIFVILSGQKKIFIDMNLTFFNSWEAFLNQNGLPACEFCFPVGGQYSVGRHLKIDFASSPAAKRANVCVIWKAVGFGIAVAAVAASFFFEIPPINYNRADSLLKIAEEFMPGIREYGRHVLSAVTLVGRLRSGEIDIMNALLEIWKFLRLMNDKYGEEISHVYRKVKQVLCKMYNWIKNVFSSFFNKASESEQHAFLAVTTQVDAELIAAEKEAEEILEDSRKNNLPRAQITNVSTAMHAQINDVNNIFEGAKIASDLHKTKDYGNLHPVTLDLLRISNTLALELGKTDLKDAKDIFEALSKVVKDEFKNRIETYNKMLKAAKAAARCPIDMDLFNKTLDIAGNPKEHYWKEAVTAVMTARLSSRIKDEIINLQSKKEILIVELAKESEEDVSGFYRCVGVKGAGKYSANDLINALKKNQVNLKDEQLVINETSSIIFIRADILMISVSQEVDEENTSRGIVWIARMED